MSVIKTQQRLLLEPSFNLRMTLDVKYTQGRLVKRYCEKLNVTKYLQELFK